MDTAWRGEHLDGATEAALTTGVPRGQGLISVAIMQGQPLYVQGYAQQAVTVPSYYGAGVQDVAYIPLGTEAQGLLLLVFVRLHQSRVWRERDRELFASAARIVAVAVERRTHLHLMETAALSDALTHLSNRRAFDLDSRLTDARRHGYNLGVLILDLDELKRINDHEGHGRGDAYLLAFATALGAVFRANDRVYRLGGDEYSVLLSHPAPGSALQILDRVRRAVTLVRAAGFPEADVSAGMAFYPAERDEASALVRLDDEPMYEEKRDHLRADKGT